VTQSLKIGGMYSSKHDVMVYRQDPGNIKMAVFLSRGTPFLVLYDKKQEMKSFGMLPFAYDILVVDKIYTFYLTSLNEETELVQHHPASGDSDGTG
jgi:hypothetical protein